MYLYCRTYVHTASDVALLGESREARVVAYGSHDNVSVLLEQQARKDAIDRGFGRRARTSRLSDIKARAARPPARFRFLRIRGARRSLPRE